MKPKHSALTNVVGTLTIASFFALVAWIVYLAIDGNGVGLALLVFMIASGILTDARFQTEDPEYRKHARHE